MGEKAVVTAAKGPKAAALVKAAVGKGDVKARGEEAAKVLTAVREENAARLFKAKLAADRAKEAIKTEKADVKTAAENDRKGAIESAPAAFKTAAQNVETGRKATITAALQTGVALSRLLASGVIHAGKQSADSGKLSLRAYVNGDVFKPMADALVKGGTSVKDVYTWATRATNGVKVLLEAGADAKMLADGFPSKMSLRALHMLGYAAGRKDVDAGDVGRYALGAVRSAEDVDNEFAKDVDAEDTGEDAPTDETAGAILDAHKEDKANKGKGKTEAMPEKLPKSGTADLDAAYDKAHKALTGLRDAVLSNEGHPKLADYGRNLTLALQIALAGRVKGNT